MPNRQAVIKTLAQDVIGAQVWDGCMGTPANMPVADYDTVEAAMAAVLERVARAVHWDRLLMEASWRHMHLHADKPKHPKYYSVAENVCGECLEEALLSDRTGAPDWEKHSTAVREHEKTDWPAVVAENIKHRAASHWHPYMAEEA